MTLNKKNYKKNRKEVKENENELLVFGYSCHIFRDDINAERLEKENGDLLIPWHDDEKYSLYLDRYDVRNLIEDKQTLEKMENEENIQSKEEFLYDDERYRDLDSEEEKLNEMSEEEREIYLELKKERKEKEKEQEKEKEKGKEKEKEEEDDSIDIIKPSSEKQMKIIEKTAKFITESTNPQIEIIIQTKQSSNPLFNFLNKSDILYPYYQHVCLLMRMGVYIYSKEEINSSENINEDLIKNEEKKINENEEKFKKKSFKKKIYNEKDKEAFISDVEKKIPENTKLIIEKMANYIARNGKEFESLVRQKNIGDERFSFMQPWNEFYNYYNYHINKCLIEMNNNQDSNKSNCSSNEIDNNIDKTDEKIINNNNKDDLLSKNNKKLEEEKKILIDENKDIKEIKAKRLKKMKEILARKKLKKN